MKRCPYCNEGIEEEAVVCRACNRALADANPEGSYRPPWGIPLAVAGALLSVASGSLGVLGTALLWIGLVGAAARGHVLVRLACGLILVILIVTTVADLTRTVPATPAASGPGTVETARAERVQSEPMLAIVSSRGYEQGGYHFVEGEVTNLTTRPLEHVTAVAKWYTEDGTLVTTDTALVEKDPILPGQTSPFKTGIRSTTAMDTFSIEFTHFDRSISTRDDSKRP
jgi:hypothetical protein